VTAPVDRRLGRPRLVALLIALVGVLGVLCCGGSISAILIGGLGNEDDQRLLNASMGCGEGGPLDPNSKMPTFPPYGVTQMRNAAIIINVGADLKIPVRGWVIAVATAMQESRLTNLGNLGKNNDHDSLGLFQQRPSAGWGSPAQVRDPEHASRKFYEKLRTIDGWASLPLTVAAQMVQISAYPDAYAKHESNATEVVNLLANGAARAPADAIKLVCASGELSASGWVIPLKAIVGSGFRTPSRPNHQGVDLIVGRYTPIGASSSGRVTKMKCDEDHSGRQTCNQDGWPGKGGCGWMVEVTHEGGVMTRYCHMVERPYVREGQLVNAGQILGRVGTSGNSSGEHLHFEVHLNNDRTSAGAINPVPFMKEHGAPLGGQQ
jgi:hypothetical protein